MQETWVQSLDWEDPLKEEGSSLITQLVNNLSAMQETLVRFLVQDDQLEEG